MQWTARYLTINKHSSEEKKKEGQQTNYTSEILRRESYYKLRKTFSFKYYINII